MTDIIGIGNPLMDILIQLDEASFKSLRLKKGQSSLVSNAEILALQKKLSHIKHELAPGGSVANTIYTLANLGSDVAFIGNAGNDTHGKAYSKALKDSDVKVHINHDEGMTGSAITLITPDSERTFVTHLGVATKLRLCNIPTEEIKNAKILHLTAYQFTDPESEQTCFKAMDFAKKNNVKISFDIAAPNIVASNLKLFKDIVENYVDILFANEEEAKAYTQLEPEKAVEALAKHVGIAIVKMGAKGSLIRCKDETIKVPPFLTDAIDTTGAGDSYAAGFLHGYTQGLDLYTSGLIGSYAASKVVQVLGARVKHSLQEEVQRFLNNDI